MVLPICVAAYCAVWAAQLARCAGVVVCPARTLPVLLEFLYDFVYDVYVGVALALRLADLLRVAAALGDEVVAVTPPCQCCQKRS